MKNWSWKKKIITIILIVLVIIQFIRPAKNTGEPYGPNDYTKSVSVTPEIKQMIETSCFDCHSNKTNHMWYENIQPLGWWTANHISEGKEELNFSEFNTYENKRKAHKFEEIAEAVEEGEMPLKPYLITHGGAKLNEEQKKQLIDWALLLKKKFSPSEAKLSSRN